jgi:hypothetical protein
MRHRIALEYSKNYLEIDRPSPLVDNYIEALIQEVLSGSIEKDVSNEVYEKFKLKFTDYLRSSKLNTLVGLEKFDRIDVCSGCTQYIDCLYMQGPIQTLSGDYKYHTRLNPDLEYSVIGNLRENIPLVIAMPFPKIGSIHEKMFDILEEANKKNIKVHIDGAWVTCCKNVHFDFSHPAIESVAISLSKGLGLGWNRVALRWTKNNNHDSISIMNDFNMNLKAPVLIGLYFLDKLKSDYLWETHGDNYYKVCNDFSLTPTDSIYLALDQGHPVGVSPLIRYLENAK